MKLLKEIVTKILRCVQFHNRNTCGSWETRNNSLYGFMNSITVSKHVKNCFEFSILNNH